VAVRPTTALSFVGAAINNGQQAATRIRLSDGGQTQWVDYTISLSDWVLPSTNGNVLDGSLQPRWDDTVVGWMPHRLATETAADAGAYLFASRPFVAPSGWTITGVRFGANATNTRIFALATAPPTFSLSSSSAGAGQMVTVTGSGFLAGEPVSVSVSTDPVGTATITADSQGNLVGTLVVPRAASLTGSTPAEVTAWAASLPGDPLPTLPLSVTSAHTYTPTASASASAQVGEPVEFHAAGFEPGELVTASLGGNTVTLTASGAGSVVGAIEAPGTAGAYTLTLAGAQSRTPAQVSVTITPAPPVVPTPLPTVTVPGPTVIHPGPTVTKEGPTVSVPGTPGPTITEAGPTVIEAGPTITRPGPTVSVPGTAGTVVPGALTAKTLPLAKLGVSATRVPWGKAVTLAAALPTGARGTVTFLDGARALGTATLTGGKASLTVGHLGVGGHALTLAYGGDAEHQATTTSATLLTVVKAAPSRVSLKVKAARGPLVVVKVAKLTNGKVATGKVRLFADGKAVKTVKLKAKAKGKVRVKVARAAAASKVKARYIPKDKAHVKVKNSKAVRVAR
jgi:hypothetical protein